MFNLAQFRRSTARLPDFLPWAALVAPGVVLQKDAVLQKTIGFRGQDLASSDDAQLASSVARLNNAFKRLDSGWSLFVEAQRVEASDYPSADWSHEAARALDLERERQFSQAGSHFESSYYLTFVWKMPSQGHKQLEGLFFDDPSEGSGAEDNLRDLLMFETKVGEMTDILAGVFDEVHALSDDETLTYLHSTVSTHRHPVKMPPTPMYLDAFLPDQPFTPGEVCLLGDSFLFTCTFVDFPGETYPGMLDDLNHLGIEYRWVNRFIGFDKAEAEREIRKYRKRWWSKRKNVFTMLKEEATQEVAQLIDNDAANKAADADAALQALGEDHCSFGLMTTTVTVWHRDLDVARERMAHVKQVIQSRGITVKDETFNSQDAWFGSLPGHVYANIRRPMVSTLNLACMLPFSAIWAGDETNAHLQEVCGVGTPHIVCSTSGATPFRLNLNVGDVGHTLIVGPTGSGKSTLLGMLELQFLKYPDAQVVIFDKGRSARAATLAVGGEYYEPGNNHSSLSFQPLAWIDDPTERVWAAEFIEGLLMVQGLAASPTDKKEIDHALRNMASSDRHQRTLTVFCDVVQSRSIRDALRPYTLEGLYGQLFDADHDGFREGFWHMVEMGHLMAMGEAAVVPALHYLFRQIDKRCQGRPTLLVLDEAWLFLKHDLFVSKLQNWLKTLRKNNAYVVFATQEVADAIESPILATILSACHTKIFLPDEEAETPIMKEAYKDFGLSDTEVSLLARARKKREYYYRSSKGRRLFSLDMGPIALALAASSSDDDHRFLDALEASDTDSSHYFYELLRHKGVMGAFGQEPTRQWMRSLDTVLNRPKENVREQVSVEA